MLVNKNLFLYTLGKNKTKQKKLLVYITFLTLQKC